MSAPPEPTGDVAAVVDAAITLVAGLDGTWVDIEEYVERLRETTYSAEVDPRELADLIEAVAATGAEGWWSR